jgi:hypothetical protein
VWAENNGHIERSGTRDMEQREHFCADRPELGLLTGPARDRPGLVVVLQVAARPAPALHHAFLVFASICKAEDVHFSVTCFNSVSFHCLATSGGLPSMSIISNVKTICSSLFAGME